MQKEIQKRWVDIDEITKYYLPISKKKARRFILCYLNPKRIGNRLYVEREKLEALLHDPDSDCFPLHLP